jgi:uncharacterized protein YcnI
MSHTRMLARACALPVATAAIALSLAAPAGAHVTATPSTAVAGASTVLTFSVGHGCEGSPTTRIEIQVPESVLSVTATRNPFYGLEPKITKLDEPATDAHGNEVTERTSSIVYTATTPLPEGQRDAFELTFQVPDAAGETLAFPTIQTCEEGESAWTEVPAEGQDPHELEQPAPSFEILPATDEGEGHDEAEEDPAAAPETDEVDDSDSAALGWAGLAAGVLGLVAGGVALARSRRSS